MQLHGTGKPWSDTCRYVCMGSEMAVNVGRGRGESWNAVLGEKQKKTNRNIKCKHYNVKQEGRKIHRGKKKSVFKNSTLGYCFM